MGIDPDLAPEYPLDCGRNAAVEHTITTRINPHFVRQTYHGAYIPVKVIVPSTLILSECVKLPEACLIPKPCNIR